MSILCYIVDDQRHGIDALVELVKKIPELKLVGVETDPYTALNKILTGAVKTDILFLDIEMGDLSGTEFAKQIGDLTTVIFVTAHNGFALDAYQLGVVDYLTKPVQAGDFIKAVSRAKERLMAKHRIHVLGDEEKFIFLKLSPRNVVKIKLADIIYVTVKDKYIDLFLGKPKPLNIKKSLSDIEEILPKEMFMRVHKSYIVNLAYIDSIVGNRINLTGNIVIEIGPSYKEEVYARFDSV